MKYADVRELINTGDLIAVRSHRGGLSALTRIVTRSPYTHTAVALWLGDRLLIAAHELFGRALPPVEADDDDLICSALSAAIYLDAGLPRGSLPSIPAPRDVAAWMGVGPTLEVRR